MSNRRLYPLIWPSAKLCICTMEHVKSVDGGMPTDLVDEVKHALSVSLGAVSPSTPMSMHQSTQVACCSTARARRTRTHKKIVKHQSGKYDQNNRHFRALCGSTLGPVPGSVMPMIWLALVPVCPGNFGYTL